MTINNETVHFTASAGHLIAYVPPKDPKQPDEKVAQASIFYMAYTRDDLPKHERPVTFFFNGGPGSSSIWLHLGAFAPKRLYTNEPQLPDNAADGPPQTYPLVDNMETLLDKSDLVFVDPVGSGFSQAIKPHKNTDFWGVNVDVAVLRNFVTRYINVNNRQSSPKYLFGESYGGGIRVPKLARTLEEAGTSLYEPDPSGKPSVVLTGLVLHSPVMDKATNCYLVMQISCTGTLPTYAMLADYHKKASARAGAPVSDYVETLRQFVKNKHKSNVALYELFGGGSGGSEPPSGGGMGPPPSGGGSSFGTSPPNPWDTLTASDAGKDYLKDLADFTGVNSAAWKAKLNMKPRDFMSKLTPGYAFNWYDARMIVKEATETPEAKAKTAYFSFLLEDEAFATEIKTFLPEQLKYSGKSAYAVSKGASSKGWSYDGVGATSGSPDLVQTLASYPSIKILAVHGYYDTVTPFHQTELDLAAVQLEKRVEVKLFEGGHMIYYSEEARAPLKKTLDEFYDAPPAATPPVAVPSLALN